MLCDCCRNRAAYIDVQINDAFFFLAKWRKMSFFVVFSMITWCWVKKKFPEILENPSCIAKRLVKRNSNKSKKGNKNLDAWIEIKMINTGTFLMNYYIRFQLQQNISHNKARKKLKKSFQCRNSCFGTKRQRDMLLSNNNVLLVYKQNILQIIKRSKKIDWKISIFRFEIRWKWASNRLHCCRCSDCFAMIHKHINLQKTGQPTRTNSKIEQNKTN